MSSLKNQKSFPGDKRCILASPGFLRKTLEDKQYTMRLLVWNRPQMDRLGSIEIPLHSVDIDRPDNFGSFVR
jgi:hypothetical protein